MRTGGPEAKRRLDYKGNQVPCFTWNVDSDEFREALIKSMFYGEPAALLDLRTRKIKNSVSLALPQK